MTASSTRTTSSTRTASASSSSSTSSSSSEASSTTASVPISPIGRSNQPRPIEQSSEEEEGNADVECPSFVRDRAITRTLHEFELEDEEIPEPDFSWDARTISHHLARYIDDLCGWVPDPKVQYRRVAPSPGKNGQKTKGMSKSDLEAQVRRLSMNSRVASRMKAMTMDFEFRHYHNPKKYMEQYRRFHTCGGPLEKLAAHDTSYGRKRSIYYAGEASAEAGFKVDNATQPKQETRLTTAQLQPVASAEKSDAQRPTQSRQRQNSESRSEQSRTEATSVTSSTSTLPPAVSTQNTAVHNETTSLPRYCSLTEAANRKRQVYSHWMGIPASRVPVPSSAPRPTRNSDTAMSPNLPTKLTATDDAASHALKPQSCTPTGTGSTALPPNNGLKPTFHNPLVTNPNSASSGNAGDAINSALRFGSPPDGPHALWKATHFPPTADNHTLPVAFGGMAGNFSTGVTLDDSCYGYQSSGATSSEGSAFRDFYSHLLQAAHYLRLAGRQKSMDNASKHHNGPRLHGGPMLYKSPKTITVTSPTNENLVPGFADHAGLPANVAIANGLGVRGQRLNSATKNERSSHSANPALGGGAGTRQFVNAPAFKSTQARFNSSPAKISHQDPEAESNFSRKRFISLEPPASSTFRENNTRAVSDGGQREHQKNTAGKMFHISIPHKPCKAEASQLNKAAVCQAVCFKSESQEALALANGNAPKK